MRPGSVPRLLLITPGSLPSATIYIVKPLRELARRNMLKFQALYEPQVTPAWIRASDIVLFCRNIDPEYDWILEECLRLRIPISYDLDDNFWEVPTGLLYSSYHRAPERIRQLERYLTHVDLVRVYSQALAERSRDFNPNARLVIPCIDMSLVQEMPQPRRDTRVRVTYVTGRGGGDALLSEFSSDLLRLLDLYPDRIEVTWWGEKPELFRDLPSSRMVDIIHDYDQYLRFLSNESFDIGLAPLTPTSFNLAKTNTKFRDYGACRIAGIYSNVPVYSAVRHEETGLLIDNLPGAWFDAMQRLVIDTKLRENIQEAAYAYVYQHYRQELVEKQWLRIIDELLPLARPDFPVGLLHTPALSAAEKPPVRICLSEQSPQPGFWWIASRNARDFNIPVPHVIAEPNALPFAGDSVDFVLVDGAIDHDQNPECALAEFFRVARHTAPVVIYAACNTGGEQSPEALPDATPAWLDGLSPGEPSVSGLRCLYRENFYRTDILEFPEDPSQVGRQAAAQPCEAVLLKCQAIKEPGTEGSSSEQSARPTGWVEPLAASLRRLEDNGTLLKDEIAHGFRAVEILQARVRAKEQQIYALEIEMLKIKRNFQDESQALRDAHEAEINDLKRRHEVQSLDQENTTVELKRDYIVQIQDRENAIAVLRQEAELQMPRARLLAHALEAQHGRRINRWLERLFDRRDYAQILIEPYRQMIDDSRIFQSGLRGYRLRPSPAFGLVACRSYRFQLTRPGLQGIAIAPIFDLFPRSGALSLELHHLGQILVHASMPAEDIHVDEPLIFNFPPLAQSLVQGVQLRVCGRDLDVPVRIYEWQRYTSFGLGRQVLRPFVGLYFPE